MRIGAELHGSHKKNQNHGKKYGGDGNQGSVPVAPDIAPGK
jgi:hypothetical protein